MLRSISGAQKVAGELHGSSVISNLRPQLLVLTDTVSLVLSEEVQGTMAKTKVRLYHDVPCSKCGGTCTIKMRDHTLKIEDRNVLVRNVPTYVCNACGHEQFSLHVRAVVLAFVRETLGTQEGDIYLSVLTLPEDNNALSQMSGLAFR